MTLTEFLLARIAEDEALDCEGSGEYRSCYEMVEAFEAHAQARRQIVDECQSAAAWAASPDCTAPLSYAHTAGTLHEVCKVLALPYAEHPDYRDEWRP